MQGLEEISKAGFHLFYESMVLEAKEFTEDPVLPRPKKVTRRYDSGGSSHVFEKPQTIVQTAVLQSNRSSYCRNSKALRSTNIDIATRNGNSFD